MDAKALEDAALVSDWDEVRFRAFRITDRGFELRSKSVAQAGHDLSVLLGPTGTIPMSGYAAALVALVTAVGTLI